MRKRLSTILLLAGSAALVWSASVWASAALFEKYEDWRWNAWGPETHRAFVPAVSAAPGKVSAPAVSAARPKPHDVIGWLDVPRLSISTAVLEGDDALALRLGAGHIPGTPLPGASGNVGIAAHRDSFFRSLGGIQPQDRIRLRTAQGDWEYTVESTRVVRPSDVGVLANSSQPELTLVTCYPFRYVGPAPLRFIVRARRIS
jgi:sortase A